MFREVVEQVYAIDLKNEGKHTFELTLNSNAQSDNNSTNSGPLPVALQFECPSEAIANVRFFGLVMIY
jgi:hypothetical protein